MIRGVLLEALRHEVSAQVHKLGDSAMVLPGVAWPVDDVAASVGSAIDDAVWLAVRVDDAVSQSWYAIGFRDVPW